MTELNINNKYHFKLKLFIGNKNQEFINISSILAQNIQIFFFFKIQFFQIVLKLHGQH